MELTKSYKKYNETLYLSSQVYDIINYLVSVKKNKVAIFLLYLQNADMNIYKTEELLNYIDMTATDNMVSYLQSNRRNNISHNDMFTSTQRTSLRIGRAIRKIFDTCKPALNFKYSGRSSMLKHLYSNNFIIDIPTDPDFLFWFKNNDLGEISNVNINIKTTIDGEELDINGTCIQYNKYSKITYVQYKVEGDVESKLRSILPGVNSVYTQRNFDYNANIELEINDDLQITDSDIEKFVNEYVSYVVYNKADETSKITKVSGSEIKKWYDKDNYQSVLGKLGGSCMSHEECRDYFGLYTNNPDKISMLILTNKDNKLIGRALLWSLDSGEYFMDRIYTSLDSIDNIFINYAIENNYYYRNSPPSGYKYFKGTTEMSSLVLSVTLSRYEFRKYPYVDTIRYLNTGSGLISNSGGNRTLNDTEGRWEEYYDDEDGDYDDD